MTATQAIALYTADQLREFLADTINFGQSAPGAKARSAAAVVAQGARVEVKAVQAAARTLMAQLYRVAGVRACWKCGCTDDAGCGYGCWWVAKNWCSSCRPPTARRKARRR